MGLNYYEEEGQDHHLLKVEDTTMDLKVEDTTMDGREVRSKFSQDVPNQLEEEQVKRHYNKNKNKKKIK